MSDEPTEGQGEDVPVASLDPAMVEVAMRRLRDQQNLGAGILAGAVAAVAGAVSWALVTVVTEYQIGWMAVGIGFLVGYAIRAAGKGVDPVFGLAGALLALLGCLLGNLMTVCYFVSQGEGIPMMDLIPQLTPEIVIELMTATFSPMDLLFYAIAVYEGYQLSTRPVTEEDLQAAATGPVIG